MLSGSLCQHISLSNSTMSIVLHPLDATCAAERGESTFYSMGHRTEAFEQEQPVCLPTTQTLGSIAKSPCESLGAKTFDAVCVSQH